MRWSREMNEGSWFSLTLCSLAFAFWIISLISCDWLKRRRWRSSRICCWFYLYWTILVRKLSSLIFCLVTRWRNPVFVARCCLRCCEWNSFSL